MPRRGANLEAPRAWFAPGARKRTSRGTSTVSRMQASSSDLPRLAAPIVLAHGLFGFNKVALGRLILTAYFRGIPEALEAAGNRVLVTRVPSIAGVEARARSLGEQIDRAFPNQRVHVIGHSMGGLDARRLLGRPGWSRRFLSLSTVGSPHLGTSLADFAKLRVGRIYRLLEGLGIDPHGCLDVTRQAARRYHRKHPTPMGVPCYSVAGDPDARSLSWLMRRPHAALLELEGPNDGLVSVESALAFGTPLGVWPIDHLQQLNWLTPEVDDPDQSPIGLYRAIVSRLVEHDSRPSIRLPAIFPAIWSESEGSAAGSDHDPAAGADRGAEPGAGNRLGCRPVDWQNLIDSQFGAMKEPLEFAPAKQMDAHAWDASVGHRAIAKLTAHGDRLAQMPNEPAPALRIAQIEPDVMGMEGEPPAGS